MLLLRAQSQLAEVKGHLVSMPLNFLEKEKLFETTAAVNPLTMAVYL